MWNTQCNVRTHLLCLTCLWWWKREVKKWNRNLTVALLSNFILFFWASRIVWCPWHSCSRWCVGFSPWNFGFIPGWLHVRFMLDIEALQQVFCSISLYFPATVIPPSRVGLVLMEKSLPARVDRLKICTLSLKSLNCAINKLLCYWERRKHMQHIWGLGLLLYCQSPIFLPASTPSHRHCPSLLHVHLLPLPEMCVGCDCAAHHILSLK